MALVGYFLVRSGRKTVDRYRERSLKIIEGRNEWDEYDEPGATVDKPPVWNGEILPGILLPLNISLFWSSNLRKDGRLNCTF